MTQTLIGRNAWHPTTLLLALAVWLATLGNVPLWRAIWRLPETQGPHALMTLGTLTAAVLAFTAAKMIVNEQLLSGIFGPREAPEQLLRWGLTVLCIVGVLGTAWLATRRKPALADDSAQA